MKSVYLYLFGFLWPMLAGSRRLYTNYPPAENHRSESERLLGGLPVTAYPTTLALLPGQSLDEDEFLLVLIRLGFRVTSYLIVVILPIV